MKTILRVTSTNQVQKTMLRMLETIPEKKDFLLIHEPHTTSSKKDSQFYDYDYCKHEVTDRTWHIYEDHTEADVLLSKCNRQDKCIFDLYDSSGKRKPSTHL